MKRKTITHTNEPTEAEIQHAAFLLWLESGRPEGRDQEHWFAAKEMLCHRAGARKRAPVAQLAEAVGR